MPQRKNASQKSSKKQSFANTAESDRALTVDEARDAILNSITRTQKTNTLELSDAVGHVCAEDIHACHDIPPFQNSAMDGYAIRHQDAADSRQFKIIGTSLAGHPFHGELHEGDAVRITTGAAIPTNADAIVIQELVSRDGDAFTTNAEIKAEQYIRYVGDDISAGQLLIAANTKLTAADTGLLAAQGMGHIKTYAKARVGVFSTGDELCNAGESLANGQIFDSNRTTIQSVLKQAGIESVDLGICKDDPQALTDLMNKGAEVDFILSSGGVSVGEADYVKQALQHNGKLFFWKVAMKPGKPLVSGKLSNGAFYFGLPGNPVSSLVTCLQFVIPAIRAFSGAQYRAPIVLQAKCHSELTKEPGRFEFQRGVVKTTDSGELIVSTTGLQDSHVLSSMSKANCFICLDQFSSGAKPNDRVSVMLFESYTGL